MVTITFQAMVLLSAPWLSLAVILLSKETAWAAPKFFLITTEDDSKEAIDLGGDVKGKIKMGENCKDCDDGKSHAPNH